MTSEDVINTIDPDMVRCPIIKMWIDMNYPCRRWQDLSEKYILKTIKSKRSIFRNCITCSMFPQWVIANNIKTMNHLFLKLDNTNDFR